jgi:hypothetical protein
MLNRNMFFRIGWGWVGPGEIPTLPKGGEIFRIAVGRKGWVWPFPIRLHF